MNQTSMHVPCSNRPCSVCDTGREACERELQQVLGELAESGPSELQAYATDCLAGCRASTEECRMLHTELRLQVTGMSQSHASLRAQVQQDGLQSYGQECQLVGGEIRILKEDLDLQLSQLGEEAECLTAELAAGMPSSMASAALDASSGLPQRQHASRAGGLVSARSPSGGGEEALSVATRGPGSNTGKDALELEAVISGYPLTSEQVRSSIREVHEALKERFQERLETWRLECEASGLGSATGEGSSLTKYCVHTSSVHRKHYNEIMGLDSGNKGYPLYMHPPRSNPTGTYFLFSRWMGG